MMTLFRFSELGGARKDDINKQVDVYKAAQAAPIIGRGTDPTSDQVADPSSETRPFKANQKTFAQIKKRARGRNRPRTLLCY